MLCADTLNCLLLAFEAAMTRYLNIFEICEIMTMVNFPIVVCLIT